MSAEVVKVSGKVKQKTIGKKSRGKGKDDYNWRADPERAQEGSCLNGGYKSIKHRWLSMYRDQAQDSQSRPATQPLQQATWSIGDGALLEAERKAELAPSTLNNEQAALESETQAGEKASLAKRGEVNAEAARLASEQAEAEVKEQAERRARHKTNSSLKKERDEKAAKDAQRQAEEELVTAAEADRAAQVASSLRKDKKERTSGEDNLASQISHRSSDNAADTSADMHQRMPAMSTSDNYPNATRQADAERQKFQHSTASAPPEGQAAGKAPLKPGKRRRTGSGSPLLHSGQEKPGWVKTDRSERMEDEGDTQDAAKQAPEANGAQPMEISHSLGGQPDAIAKASSAGVQEPLMQVYCLDGEENEQLGELDLNQLDSFRDLWLTIRSAYSARLPKGDLKLIYRDVDEDLMQQQDEPWDYFRSMARGIYLAPKEMRGA